MDHIDKGVQIQRSTANQGTVDICLAEQFFQIGGFHTPSVKNADRLGNGGVIPLRQNLANQGMNFLGLLKNSG